MTRASLCSLLAGLIAIGMIGGISGCRNCKEKPPEKPAAERDLLPGEVRDARFPVPIIVAATDTICSDTLTCPTKADDCVLKEFTVELDTIYFLTAIYYSASAGTSEVSCRACVTIYEGDNIAGTEVTACPTGGPWIDFGRLRPGVTYTLAVCLQRCPQLDSCQCGEDYLAQGIVSLRRVFR